MDLKLKGITWVGNMFQKFEAVCQEVDNIISQDTVKFVGNQVNSASENMKKFCSDVVQDLLPIDDPVEDEAQAVAQKGRVAINANFKSLTLNEENEDVNGSSVGLYVNDLMDEQPSQRTSCSNMTSICEEGAQGPNNSHLELNADLHLGKNDDVLIDKDLDESIKEKAINESDDPDLQLEDETILRKNDEASTDGEANESCRKNTTIKLDATDPLEHEPNHASCQVSFTNGETILVDDSHLPIISKKNDDAVIDDDSDDSFKNRMEFDASDPLKNCPSHTSGETKLTNKDTSSLSDVLSVKNDDAVIDEDSDLSLKDDVILEPNASNSLKNCPSHTCRGTSFASNDTNLVSEDSHFFLESHDPDTGSLSSKNSNESFENDTMEHDSSYPVKNRCISNSINYENEDVISAAIDSLLNFWKSGEAVIEKEADASFCEPVKLEFSTELVLFKESVEGPLYSESCDNECEKNIIGVLQAKTETASGSLTYESKYSSNLPDDAVSSEPLVLTFGEDVDKTKSVSSLKSESEEYFSASRNSVESICSSAVTVFHDKPIDHCESDDFETRPSFDVIKSASCENNALEKEFASPRSSLLSLQSLEKHALKAHESGSFPKLCASNRIQCSEPTSSKALIASSELGSQCNSRDYIPESDMESIDLGGKATLKGSCDIVDFKALHVVSRRTRKLRSYKERIQDAFTSKKRIAKEYEQLVIWYGDADLEFSTDSSQRLPVSGEMLPDSKKAPSSSASDSEWELL